jgi:FkbM family methyltransferase
MQKHFIEHNITNVKIYNKAVSDTNEFLKFYVSSSNRDNNPSINWNLGNKSSSILKPEKHLDIIDFIQFENIINVDSITLRSFFVQESLEYIDIMQIDVQGAELMVLKGLGDKIKNVYVIWLEVSKLELYKEQPLQTDIYRFMRASGFMLVKDTLYNLQGDHLYVSIDKFGYIKLLCLKLSVIFRDFYIRVINKLRRFLFR